MHKSLQPPYAAIMRIKSANQHHDSRHPFIYRDYQKLELFILSALDRLIILIYIQIATNSAESQEFFIIYLPIWLQFFEYKT